MLNHLISLFAFVSNAICAFTLINAVKKFANTKKRLIDNGIPK